MMALVSLAQTMLHSAPSQITIDQIRRLVAMVGPESSTLEYKGDMTSTIAKAVAALANTYGGLVLVGVTDDRRITGVKEKTLESVSEHCHSTLEPPWVPDIVPVPMDDRSGRYILVMRVVPGVAPRPLLVDGAAPVRHHNTTHPANWQQLAALFAESDALVQADPWIIRAPGLPRDESGVLDEEVDLVARCGLNIAIDPRAAWRPLGERDIDQLAEALNRSNLPGQLAGLVSGDGGCGSRRFHRRGHNRSRVIRLQWCALPSGGAVSPIPVEALLSAEVPGGYGQVATHLLVHLDVTVRIASWVKAEDARWVPADRNHQDFSEPSWRMSIEDLRGLMDAMVAALVDQDVVGALAGLAQIDSLAVPQPRVLHLVTRRPIPLTLDTDRLTRIPEADTSKGAHLLADPGLDLTDPDSRHHQVDAWLVQTALDAGRLGMEELLMSRPWPRVTS
ncbi:helix-turn-helix domain-containing protein [Actinomadura sp. NTSP31]|uniref:AlbA family DNA-binding domain-containing protein n=1 Tax=Actinomadura sp. NTSP31 TaxID=1735447 RepID=UPI0035BFF3B6